jgi:GDP-L-fucose synthase
MSPGIRKDSRIYVAGHRGLVGSAIVRALQREGYTGAFGRTHADLDLTDGAAVREFFARERPQFVVLAAARVGGIVANDTRPADFIHDNLAIQTHVIHESWRAGVERLLFLGSSCIYPRDCAQPIREEYLLTGPLEATNEAYAVAKIAGVKMCAAYNRQHGTRFLAVMPTNLYGIGDSYDLQGSHVVPALIRKAHEARERGTPEPHATMLRAPRRELLLSDDLAEACMLLLRLEWGRVHSALPDERLPLVNVGVGRDVSIRELAQMVCETVGFSGGVEWDASKPDGTPQKRLDISRIAALGWRAATPLREGLAIAYRDFLRSYSTREAVR